MEEVVVVESPGVVMFDGSSVVVAAAPLQFIRSKAESARGQARDDVGRWRKIYYRLRRSQSSTAKVDDALRLVRDAERRASLGEVKGAAKTEKVRRGIKGLGLAQEIDERATAKLIADAKGAARLMRRLEALGDDTMVSMGQLPQAMQDSIKDYLRLKGLEPRITKHFGPFAEGNVKRSVRDILNLLDRTVVDAQKYQKGYDLERS